MSQNDDLKQLIESKRLSVKVDSDEYLNSLSKEEMQSMLSLEFMKALLGKKPGQKAYQVLGNKMSNEIEATSLP